MSLLIEGTPTTAAGLTAGDDQQQHDLNFPSGNGVELVGVQITSTTGPRATFGVPDTTNQVVVSGNDIRGNATNKMGVFGVAASVTGMADGNVRIANNGTAAVPMQNILGEGIGVGRVRHLQRGLRDREQLRRRRATFSATSASAPTPTGATSAGPSWPRRTST